MKAMITKYLEKKILEKLFLNFYLIVYHHQNWKLPIIHEQENCIYYFP